jgi:hypothetical protein
MPRAADPAKHDGNWTIDFLTRSVPGCEALAMGICGRYSIALSPEAIRETFQTQGELPNRPAYYNARPQTGKA